MSRSSVAGRSGLRWPVLGTIVAAVIGLGLTSCGNLESTAGSPTSKTDIPQDAATWQVIAAPEPTPRGATVHLGVTRLGCANGVTGEVLEPTVLVEEERVVISTPVEHFPGGADCPTNDVEYLDVELPADALGKDLVDAACLNGGEAATTAACSLGPARWHLPTLAGVNEVVDWTAPADYNFQVTSLCGERAFLGTFDITVSADTVTSVESLDGRSPDLTEDDAMTVQDMLQEANARLRGGGTVRLSLDEQGNPRYIAIGDNLAQSDGASCYFIHKLSAPSS
ncbi:DUF6174 domain-containing protein [Serinicoccus chungangensis]|uniref:DUF6174 domain-containing protein n=1 Tax=Serinicoccus chungangensis TaxID=767452 RepID=UPI00128F5763|nr:hypothetical protein [Serinicoccus chungangensis]